MQERLQKIIAHAGVTSRRRAEELIIQGRVAVNGRTVTELGAKADPQAEHVTVDGQPVSKPERPIYLLFNKPRGVVSTLRDPEGRRSLADFVGQLRERVYPVGRLDYNSEGLLLLTNDGEFAHRVSHASSELPKTYWVKVSQRPAEAELERLRSGIYLDGRRTAPAQIRWLTPERSSGRLSAENPWLEVVLIEGRTNQIRRMFASIGHPVEKLKRVAIGFLKPGKLELGEIRLLTPAEVAKLKRATAQKLASNQADDFDSARPPRRQPAQHSFAPRRQRAAITGRRRQRE